MFGCIVAGRAVQTNLQSVSPTQFIFILPSPGSINHLVVFLLPDTILPPTHAATVHIRFPTSQGGFQLLGAISAAKPSAVFRVRGAAGVGVGEVGEVTLGISVESVESVEAQLAVMASGQLVKAGAVQGGRDTLQLARRIIGSAFNYLGSFSMATPGGEEMVPLRAFREWWVKFEKKVEYDPRFLERGED